VRSPDAPDASVTLSERLKTNVYTKLEVFQKTGSFKVRGAFNQNAQPEAGGAARHRRGQRSNHAQRAYVARALDEGAGLMPESTPRNMWRRRAATARR